MHWSYLKFSRHGSVYTVSSQIKFQIETHSFATAALMVRDLRGTPKPDYDSDSDGVEVGVAVSKTEFF